MKLLMIRHAEMAGDPFICPERPVSGCLSPTTGIGQAEATKTALESTPVDYVFSSPYGRALQTAEIVFGKRDIPIRLLPALREWDPSEKVRKMNNEEFEATLAKNGNRYIEETWKTEVGEGKFEMYARVVPAFLLEMETIGVHARMGGYVPDAGARDLTIAVVAHGGSLSVLLEYLLNVHLQPVGHFAFEHTGVAELRFSEHRGILYPQLVIRALHEVGA